MAGPVVDLPCKVMVTLPVCPANGTSYSVARPKESDALTDWLTLPIVTSRLSCDLERAMMDITSFVPFAADTVPPWPQTVAV
jgi:hypothetical protein